MLPRDALFFCVAMQIFPKLLIYLKLCRSFLFLLEIIRKASFLAVIANRREEFPPSHRFLDLLLAFAYLFFLLLTFSICFKPL